MKHTYIEDVVRQGSGAGSDIDNLTIDELIELSLAQIQMVSM